MDHDQLRRTALARLRTLGPTTSQELVDDLDLGDDWTAQELYELLLDEHADDDEVAFPLHDRRLCHLEGLLEGLTLTHVITPEERGSGTVEFAPDLTVTHLVSRDGRTFPLAGDGDDVLELAPGAQELSGPAGWLPDQDVLVLRVVDGRLEVGGLDTVPEVDERSAARLRTTLDTLRAVHTHPIDEIELAIEVRARYPRWLDTPQAPVRELLAAEDLVATDRGVVTSEEADEDDDPTEELVAHLRTGHGLDDEQIGAVLGVRHLVLELQNVALQVGVAAMREAIEQGREVDPVEALRLELAEVERALAGVDVETAARHLDLALDDVAAAMALVEDVIDDETLAAACLLGLLERARPASKTRGVRANTAWVRGAALEFVADDHAVAERELRRARELDPDHGPAAFALAGYLSDRGQAGAALGLLHLIEGPGVEEQVELLTRYAGPGPMSAGRNDPCPCGSGRKHKVCCAARNGWPLPERMPWVMQKLMTFYGSSPTREVVDEVARACGMAEVEGSYRDTAALNLALFEGGVIAELCDRRGSLLPADELELLRDWSQVRGGLYELVESSDDGTCVLLDLAAGERIGLVDRSLAGTLDVGGAVFAWMVDEGDRTVPFYGVVSIPDTHRADLLDLLDEEPPATVLGAWLRDLHAPPRMATTAGDALVSVERTYTVPDGHAARTALAAHLEEDETDGTLRAFEDRDGMRWLKGTVDVDEGRLVVSTMSVPRAAWFAELLERVVPDAELVDEQRIPVADLLAGREDGLDGEEIEDDDLDDDALLDLESLPPEARSELEAKLEEFMSRHEDAWVDTPLPALGGATPREALEDPTRRDAVLRLLDDMERTAASWEGPGRGMDPTRLRRLLGLR